MKELVSVIIPTYNREMSIMRSICSVLNQTYKNIEVIVVDDASNDKTEYIVESINDNRIRYIKHDIQKGGSAARNTGIAAARGKYIAFQDSDDEWLPAKIEKQMKILLMDEEIGVVYTGFIRFSKDLCGYVPEPWAKVKEGDISSQICRGNFVGTVTILCRKELINEVGGFDESLSRFQDWEFVIRLANFTKFKIIDEPLVIAHQTPVSITSDQSALLKSLDNIINKHQKLFKQSPKHFSHVLAFLGHMNFLYGSFRKGYKNTFESIRYNPFKMIPYLILCGSVFGSKIYRFLFFQFSFVKKNFVKN